jgi:hypothetical protein
MDWLDATQQQAPTEIERQVAGETNAVGSHGVGQFSKISSNFKPLFVRRSDWSG